MVSNMIDNKKSSNQANKKGSKNINYLSFIQKNQSKIAILAFAFFWIIGSLISRPPDEKNNTMHQKIVANKKIKKTEEYQNGVIDFIEN